MKIITLTLNPAFDLHLYMDTLCPLADNVAHTARREAGGKGVNLTRALAAGGLESLAYLLLPRESEREYLSALEGDGILPIYDTVMGFVRENINIHTRDGDTVIATEGSPITAADVERVEQTLLHRVDSDTCLVFSGGIPKGSCKVEIISFLAKARERGARLVLDSRSLTKDEIFGLSPYLIKPNIDEMSALLGERLDGIRDAVPAAEGLFRDFCGAVENLIITAGAEGSALVTKSGAYKALPPKIEAISAVGAGDSTVAGFLAAVNAGLSDLDKLRLATAFGASACLEEGTKPPRPESILELYPAVNVEKINI